MNAARRYSLVTFLTWLPPGLWMAPGVVLMLERGLDVPTIALVWLAYSVTVSVLELPTGGLADVVGRRGVLIAAAVTSLAGLVLAGLATTVAVFAVSAFMRGVSRALGSGPAEAWYVDTVHAQGKSDIGPGLARGQVALSAALAIGTISGGVIPLALAGSVPTPLAIPIFVAAAVEAVRLLVVLFAMPEPRYARMSIKEILRGVPATVRNGLTLSLHDGALARVLLITGGIGAALGTIELLTPAWLTTVTGAFETASIAYALVAALGFASSAMGGALSAQVTRVAGSPARAAMIGSSVMAAALAVLAGATLLSGLAGISLAGVAYCAIFIGLGIGNPPRAAITHQRVTAGRRATVLSVQSLGLQLAGVVGVNLMARLPGPAVAFLIVAIVIAISGLLLRSPKMVVSPSTASTAA